MSNSTRWRCAAPPKKIDAVVHCAGLFVNPRHTRVNFTEINKAMDPPNPATHPNRHIATAASPPPHPPALHRAACELPARTPPAYTYRCSAEWVNSAAWHSAARTPWALATTLRKYALPVTERRASPAA